MPHYEPGIYENVLVTGQGFGVSSQKKTPFFFLNVKPGDYERQIQWYLPDGNEGCAERLIDDLETLGIEFGAFAELDPASRTHVSLAGQLITVECRHEEATDGSGRQFERWQLPYAPKPLETHPADAAMIRKLDAMFGKALKGKRPAQRQAASAAKPAAKAPTQEQINQELAGADPAGDIPF